MKAFANITLGELSKVLHDMHRNGVPANLIPDMVNWEAVAEYIFEAFGNEYDNDDIDFVHETLCVSHNAKHLYVLEVQEVGDGAEVLYIETITNTR